MAQDGGRVGAAKLDQGRRRSGCNRGVPVHRRAFEVGHARAGLQDQLVGRGPPRITAASTCRSPTIAAGAAAPRTRPTGGAFGWGRARIARDATRRWRSTGPGASSACPADQLIGSSVRRRRTRITSARRRSPRAAPRRKVIGREIA